MFQQFERAAKLGSIIVNTTMLGLEVYKYFHNGSPASAHTETPGAE